MNIFYIYIIKNVNKVFKETILDKYMNDKQRLHLQNMISANNVEDNTSLIRELKHSHILRKNVNDLLLLKQKYNNDNDKINEEALTTCSFLFTYYTDIYNKIKKDEIDLKILYKALDVLQNIEDGNLDMHEGAYQFGDLLKTIYVDSALKKADKLNNDDAPSEYSGPQVDISWKQWCKKNKM